MVDRGRVGGHLIIADRIRRNVLSGRIDAGSVAGYPEEYLLGSLGADIWYTPSLARLLPGSPISLSFQEIYERLGGPGSPLAGIREVLAELQRARDSRDPTRALKTLATAPATLARLQARLPAFTDLIFEVLPVFVAAMQQQSPLADATGWAEPDWGWGDVLHWRRTGRFVENLWAVAGQMPGAAGRRLEAFALGYLTHVATDVTSHAFVNQIVGGPARARGMVAHIVEGHMDVYAWDRRPLTGGGDLNDTDLGRLLPASIDPAFAGGIDDAVRRTYEQDAGRNRAPCVQSHGPNVFTGCALDLRTYLTLLGTYFAAPRPAQPSVEGFSGWLEKLAEIGPPPGLPPVPDIGGPPGGPGWPPTSWRPTARALKLFFEDLVNGATTAATAWLEWTEDLIELAIAGTWEATWETVDATLFAAQLPLYGLLVSYRWLPARMGFAYPLREELESRFYTVPNQASLDYPQRHAGALTVLGWLREDAFARDDLLRLSRHDTGREDPATFPGPYSAGESPLVLVDGDPNRPLSPAAAAWFTADSPAVTDAINCIVVPGGSLGLGGAVDLCRALLPPGRSVSESMAALPDLNLDSDRGYGYRCWYHWSDRTGLPTGNPLLAPVVDVGYRPDF